MKFLSKPPVVPEGSLRLPGSSYTVVSAQGGAPVEKIWNIEARYYQLWLLPCGALAFVDLDQARVTSIISAAALISVEERSA